MDTIVQRMIFAFLAVMALSSCGSSIADVTDSRIILGAVDPAAPSSDLASLTGSFVGFDGKASDLESFQEKPVVLVFAQDLCSDCYDEHEAWIGSLQDPKLSPGNVHIITVLVGATNADATAWQQDVKAPWTVGIDSGLELYKSYFGDSFGTPALVVGLPGLSLIHISEPTRPY